MPMPCTSRLASTATSTVFGRSQSRSRRMRRGLCCAATFLISISARQAVNSRFLPGYDWYLRGDEFNSKKITSGWHEKLQFALDKGFEGLRISGNAFWIEHNRWNEFREYEQELDNSLEGRPMLVLCTYSLNASRAVDVLDVARAHQFTVARRRGQWEFSETPELKQAKREIKSLGEALLVLSRPFAGHELLTSRERTVLAQIVRGASSKEAAGWLKISPRTIEFHRGNIMQKLNAKNVADLVRIVVGNFERSEAGD